MLPKKHYYKDDHFTLSGYWDLDAEKVLLTVTPFTKRSDTIYEQDMKKEQNKRWSQEIRLSFPAGLYYATLTAYNRNQILSSTDFTFYIAPDNRSDQHPRLWFDRAQEENIIKSEYSFEIYSSRFFYFPRIKLKD